MQDQFQAQSTPRMVFRQEGKDDEDMTSMHMTMLGESHGGQGDKQEHPNREGGPKLIRFDSPRWRPKSSLSPPQNPGAVLRKINAHGTYGIRFR